MEGVEETVDGLLYVHVDGRDGAGDMQGVEGIVSTPPAPAIGVRSAVDDASNLAFAQPWRPKTPAFQLHRDHRVDRTVAQTLGPKLTVAPGDERLGGLAVEAHHLFGDPAGLRAMQPAGVDQMVEQADGDG